MASLCLLWGVVFLLGFCFLFGSWRAVCCLAVLLFGGARGVGGLSGLALMESLILAQDERWRRA